MEPALRSLFSAHDAPLRCGWWPRALTTLWLAFSAPAAAQVMDSGIDVSELRGARVHAVRWDLPASVDQAAAEQLLGIHPGDALDDASLRRAVKRLALLARMEDVRVYAIPRADGVDSVELWVQLIPARLIREIRFPGAESLSMRVLRRDLALTEGDAAEEGRLVGARDAVQRTLAQEGYPSAQVEAAFDELAEPASVALVFTIRLGPPQKAGELRLAGDLGYAAQKIFDIADIGPGALASRERLEMAATRVRTWYREHGHYSARVEALPIPRPREKEWVPLTLRIHAGPRWVASFRGNRVFSSSYLQGRLGLPPDRTLDRELVDQLEEKVRAVYRDAGYLHVRVRLRNAPGTEKGTRRMLFSIREGPFTQLRKVQIEGRPELPPRVLVEQATGAAEEALRAEGVLFQRLDKGDMEAILGSGDSESEAYPQKQGAVTQVAPEWPRTLSGQLVDPRAVYDEQRYKKGGQVMADYLRSKGYLQPRIQGPQATFEQDGELLDVTYQVNAGVQTRIQTLAFRGALHMDAEALLDLARSASGVSKVLPGEPLDLFAVEIVRQALERHYHDHGFPFARVADDVQYENGRKDAHLSFWFEENGHVVVDAIEIRGNALTRNVLIRQHLDVRVGREFSQRDAEESRRRLLQLGLFSGVELRLGDEGGERRVMWVEVRERKFNDGEVGPGFSLEEGFRARGIQNFRNILGLGIVASIRGQANWPWLNYSVGLLQNSELRQQLLARYDWISRPWLRPLAFGEFQLVGSLGYPKILFLPVDTGVRVEALGIRANRLAFSLNRGGLVFTTDVKPTSYKYLRSTISPSISLLANEMQCDKPAADFVGRTCEGDPTRLTTRLDNGFFGLATFRLPVVLDGRDNIFKPHKGYLASFTTELVVGGGGLYPLGDSRTQSPVNIPTGSSDWARLGQGDLGVVLPTVIPKRTTFAKFAGSLVGYLPLLDRVTAAVGARAGTIVCLGRGVSDPVAYLLSSCDELDEPKAYAHYVPLFERFYLGGTESIRGFTPDGVLVSRGRDDGTGPRPLVSQGGYGYWNLRSEIRVQVVGQLEWAIFADAGQLVAAWNLADPSAFSSGVGMGLRYVTPVGPLVFDLGIGWKDGLRAWTLSDAPRRFVLHPTLGYW